MAKKEINRYVKEQRLLKIANCLQCGGNPSTRQCNLQGLIFNVCEQCDEIVGDYKKEGAPITVQSIIVPVTKHTDPNYKQEIKTSLTPGQLDFNDLEL